MIDLDENPVEAPAAEQPKTERRIWPLIAGSGIIAVIVATGVLHGLGGKGALIAFGVAAAAAVVLLILWRLPQLRKHFSKGRGGSRMRSMLSRTRRMGLGGGKGKLGGLLGGKRPGKGLLGGKGRSGSGKGKGLLGKGRSGGKGILGKGKAAGKGLLGKGRAGGKSILGKGRGAGKGLLGKIGLGKGKRSGGLTGKGSKGRSLRNPFGGGRKSGGGKRGLLPRLPGFKGRGKGAGKPGGKTGGKATGKTSRGRKLIGGAGKGIRGAWKRSKGFSPKKAAGGAFRGARNAWKRARGITGGKSAGKRSRLRGAGEIAAAIPLVPFIAAAALGKRIGAWWRKRRRKGQAPEATAEPDDAVEGTVVPDRVPGVALEPNTTDNPSRRKHPVSSAVESAAEAIEGSIGSFEPENVEDLGQFLQAMPQVFEALGAAFMRVADRFGDELPVHADVVEHIREMASAAAGQQEYANEAYGIFRNAHDDDLNRLENPRPGEEFTDYSRQ